MRNILDLTSHLSELKLPHNLQNDIAKIIRQNFLEAIGEVGEYLLNFKAIDYHSNLKTLSETQILMIEIYCKINKYLRSLTHKIVEYDNDYLGM